MKPPTKTTTFWILIAVSAATAFLLPARWTTPGRGLFQPLALLQWPGRWLARTASGAAEHVVPEALSGERAAALEAENAALQRQVIHQRLRLQEAERRLAELSGFTGQLPDSHVGILIAPVVAFDASPRAASLLIARGRQSQWVREGQWAIAAGSELPEWDAEARLADLLDRGWLVGRVVEVHPRVARVQLATDPRFRCAVRAARLLADGTVQLASEGALLVGQGSGRMLVPQAVRDYVKEGYGLVVVPADRDLPIPLTIGHIEGSAPRDDSPHHVDLTVVPWDRAGRLTHVYIVTMPP